MAAPIIVFGHKNPDNDSVVSATAYAYLKNATDPDHTYIPARLGPMPAEAAWLFDQYKLEYPVGIEKAAQAGTDDEGTCRVVLVDHNEIKQSAPDLEDSQVCEVIDHHRIGDVQTAHPILFMNVPVGSTATIIATRFKELGVDMPTEIAAILLSAVLTDTVILKSPTTTDVDRTMVEELSAKVGVDPVEFGMQLFNARAGEFDAVEIMSGDAKEFTVGDGVIYIVSYETVDKESVMPHIAEIKEEAERLRAENGYIFVVLMIADIIKEGSEIIAVGDTALVERALGIDLTDGSAWMPGVLSRKKQVAPPLVEAGSKA